MGFRRMGFRRTGFRRMGRPPQMTWSSGCGRKRFACWGGRSFASGGVVSIRVSKSIPVTNLSDRAGHHRPTGDSPEASSAGTRPSRRLGWALLASIPVLVAAGLLLDYWTARPSDVVATYVGRDACIDCHREQAELHFGSHHDLAMDVATDETVLGDFDDATIEHDGMTSRLFRDGDRFMVHTEGPSGEMQDFEVKYVFGVDPLQQYMVEFDRTSDMQDHEIARLQVLRISWDTHGKRWFYLRPPDVEEKLEPDDPLHWTGIAQRWQTMCADCHSTNLQRNFDTETGLYRTTFSEIDVSCEACHGPGSLHVELANRRSPFWDRRHGYGLARLKGDDAEAQIQTCAPCHSRRGVLTESFRPGDLFSDHYRLEMLHPETYFDDGQIKDEVYVYGSYLQSKMYHQGIRCTDCHDPHSLRLKHPGNETCTSCHQHAAGKYDVPSHHHHQPGTEGAMCVSCHMPHRTYMDVDPRRDHSLRVPRPDLSVKLGTPNACSGCHVRDRLDAIEESTRAELREYQDWQRLAEAGNEAVAAAIRETDRWCDEACDRWYGPDRQTPPHFAEPLANFRAGREGSLGEMLGLASETSGQAPAIARATALTELARGGHREVAEVAKPILGDPDERPELRAAAVTAYAMASAHRPPRVVAAVLMPLLQDPSRLVRIEAARALVESGVYPQLSASQRSQIDRGLREVHDSFMVSSDRAGSHLGWAILCEQRGRFEEAIRSYETAIRVEPLSTGPRTNLASLLERLAQERPGPEADRRLERVRELRQEELPLLARDASLAPENADVQYRYGLALYLAGDHEAALGQLERTVELAPDVPTFRTALELLREKMGIGPER